MKLFASLYLDEDASVLIEDILRARGFDVTTARNEKMLGRDGLDAGAIVQVERKDDTGTLHINIKGYHISLSKGDASKICVKPI